MDTSIKTGLFHGIKKEPFSDMDTNYDELKQEPTSDFEMDYESDEYYDEQGRKVTDYGRTMEYRAATVRTVPTVGTSAPKFGKKKGRSNRKVPLGEIRYTMDDMTPIVRDRLCPSTSELAYFWPVYVGNFKDDAVARYFATHGLHVRWFFRRRDPYYTAFQRKAGLYDMLVYFVSERDAELAIERCHRDTHKGYTLNVFPGRLPVYFAQDRSVYAERIKNGHVWSEQFFEKQVRNICKVKVSCVVKFNLQQGALEFERPGEVAKAQRKGGMWNFQPVRGYLRKQRFVEQDVLEEIEAILDHNPDTLRVKENDRIMSMLLRGFGPFIDQDKTYKVVPLNRGPTKAAKKKSLEKFMLKYVNGSF